MRGIKRSSDNKKKQELHKL